MVKKIFMKNKITQLSIILLITFAVFAATGCSKKTTSPEHSSSNYSYDAKNSDDSLVIEPVAAKKEDLEITQNKWHITPQKICVVLGYDFNDKEKADKMIAMLSDRYGLAEDDGLIYPMIFPDDFKANGRTYYTNLSLALQNDIPNLIGVIILGAPENTHIALSRNQDYWNSKVPYPVIALFPQDDVLGLESTCSIVLDKGQAANFNGEVLEEETIGAVIPEAPEILCQTIDYILTLEGPLPRDKSLSNHVLCMLKNHQVHHYCDPETGLQSINHFVLN